MSAKGLSYIGVTGFMSGEEVGLLVGKLSANNLISHDKTLLENRQLMIGVLVSDKTIAGGSNRWPNRYPLIEQVPEIFKFARIVSDHVIFRVVHYNTHDPNTLGTQLIELYRRCGGQVVDGVQLNVAWPYLGEIEKYREEVPDNHKIILQIGRRAMEGLTPQKIASNVSAYGPVIDYILVDPSGGYGISMVDQPFFEVLDAIQEETGGAIGLGYAGGLSASAGDRLLEFYCRYPDISIDAQGRLRDDKDDHLLVESAFEYVQTAIKAIGANNERL